MPGRRLLDVGRHDAPLTGPAVPLVRAADPGDGRLEVVLLGRGEAELLAAFVASRLQGREDELPPFEPLPSSRVRLVSRDPARLRVDDELWPAAPARGPATAFVAGKLDVLVPSSAAAVADS